MGGIQQREENENNQSDLKLQLAVQVRVLVNQIIGELKKEGENVEDFEKEIKLKKNLKRGENFEARLDQSGQPIGIGKFFSHSDGQLKIFIGHAQQDENESFGRAISIKIDLSPENQVWKLNKTNCEAILFKNSGQQTQNQNATILKMEEGRLIVLKGEITDEEIKKGKLIVKNQKREVIMQYEGQFYLNRIQGQGTLKIPNRYGYTGHFIRQMKSGFGIQNDLILSTQYVGYFENDLRHGYGELTYLKKEGVKLKGFWTQGIMKENQGMYISRDGVYLETIGKDFQLL